MIKFLFVVLMSSTVAHSSATPESELIHCKVVEDCPEPTFARCYEDVCHHKEVFPPVFSEIVGVMFLPILLGLANNGGIGGGGLIIPACIALFGFTTI